MAPGKDKKKWNARISSFFTKVAPNGKPAPKSSLKKKQLANKFSLQATDAALQGGCDSRLKAFAVPDDYADVRLPLADYEQRFFVPLAECPPDVQSISWGRQRRSCILDKRTGGTRLETMCATAKISLQVHADQGPCSRGSLIHTFCESGVRGYFWCHLREDPDKQPFSLCWLYMAWAMLVCIVLLVCSRHFLRVNNCFCPP